MNQREFARFSGLSTSTVARLEASRQDVGLRAVQQALAMVGLRLAVVHDDGTPFTTASALPFDDLGLVDRRGRQFPAHLPEDVWWYEPYWRTFRDEQAGVVRHDRWTFRRCTPRSPEAWRSWNDDLWGLGRGCDGPGERSGPDPAPDGSRAF
jgi:hypothetical protein